VSYKLLAGLAFGLYVVLWQYAAANDH
jgi:hypothetical protein